jgi:hypothetical protein
MTGGDDRCVEVEPPRRPRATPDINASGRRRTVCALWGNLWERHRVFRKALNERGELRTSGDTPSDKPSCDWRCSPKRRKHPCCIWWWHCRCALHRRSPRLLEPECACRSSFQSNVVSAVHRYASVLSICHTLHFFETGGVPARRKKFFKLNSRQKVGNDLRWCALL